MLSHALYRWARFAARRPLAMIGSWLVVSVLVIGASGAFGRTARGSFEVPGLDSQEAADLLTAAGRGQVGLTAQVVLTPRDARAVLLRLRRGRAGRPGQGPGGGRRPAQGARDTTDRRGRRPPDPGGRGERRSRRRSGRPHPHPVSGARGHDADDLENLKRLGARAGAGSPLRIEMGGDLFFAFEEAATGIAS